MATPKTKVSFVVLKRSLKNQIAVVEGLPKSFKRDKTLLKLRAIKKLLPCPPQSMTVDI